MLLAGCQQADLTTPPVVKFDPLGIQVTSLEQPVPLRLYDSNKKLLLTYPPMGREVFLFFNWQPAQTYTLQAGGKTLILQAPARRPYLEIQVSAPLGQKKRRLFAPWDTQPAPFVLAGESHAMDVGILIRSHTDRKVICRLNGRPFRLVGAFDSHFEVIHLKFGPHRTRLKVPLEILSPQIDKTDFLDLAFSFCKTDFEGAVELVSWKFPTDPFGFTEASRLQGTLALPAPLWEHIGYAMGLKASGRSRFDPTSFQCLSLKNHLKAPITLLVKADFLDPSSRRPVPGFYPKQFGPTAGTKKIMAFVDLPPGSTAKAVLPVYVDSTVAPGSYIQKITVVPMGQKKPLLVLEKEMGLMRGSDFFTIALTVIMVIAFGYALFVFFNFHRLLAKFNIRSLVLIALMGAVGFGLDFLGGMAANVLNALLGPFNILAGGLITEVFHYLILTSVLFLVPQWGTVTLSGIISYLMSGMMTGGFGILDILFVGSGLAYAEGMLYLSGITSSGEIRGRGLRLALALGLADAMMTASSLVLHYTFYRLFYPLWYVALAVIIKGFVYTFIGVQIGVPFGKTLRTMER